MKKTLIFLSLVIVAFSLTRCEKDLEQVTIKSTIAANVLTDLTAGSYTLLLDNKLDTFQIFNWTSVDYGFSASTTYTVQVDKKKKNFSSPQEILVVKAKNKGGITIGDFNKLMLNLGLTQDSTVLMAFRVKAVINPAIAPVYSNVLEATITPYNTVFPPIYMTGAATGGWGWAQYQYKELKSPAPNVYETIGYFLSGETFRFFKQADWNPTSYNYPYFTGTVSPLFENGLDGDSNFRFTGVTGYYKVTVNMTTKSVAMEAMPDQVLFMTGAALGGWNWATDYVQLTWKSNGIYQATTDFAVETFRFFAQQDWGPTSYNYPWFTGGTISNKFENANDGDKNFKFIGVPGSYTITVNMLDKIITMQ
jgi:roadblock/LC7 domain-containing protein